MFSPFHLLLLPILLFTPVRTFITPTKDEDKSPETLEKEAAKKKYFFLLSKALYEKFGLEVEPYEWPNRCPEVYYITISAQYFKDINSLEEARKLIINVTDYVIKFINNDNPDIIPFLSEYPFSPEKMLIDINLIKNMKKQTGWVAVTLRQNIVSFTYLYQELKIPTETFEEAKAKVEAESKKGGK